MTLSLEIEDLVTLDLPNDSNELRRTSQVTVVQLVANGFVMRTMVEMFHPVGVEQARSLLDSLGYMTWTKQVLGQMRTILTGDVGC